MIGSEGKGISPLVKKQCDYIVTLPMHGSVTSLNASVTAAILMYEVEAARRGR
ncbi:TrmH family RNA methyltransferase [Faecalibaculum rodentium]|uniref:TrmH family RNA methyltransferase n=1 Tax=Faecalibaculum rodentium TaxID=1702221 RepID=UPI003F4D5C2C